MGNSPLPIQDGNDFKHPLPSIQKMTQQTCLPFETKFAFLYLYSLISKLHLHSVLDGNMLDYQTYQIVQSNCDGAGDIEFDFWSARKSCYYDTFNNLDGCEIEFQVRGCVEERFGHCPIPLWGADKITDASPLLPNNHFYSNVSPTRKQAIEEGRKQLMEMIRNMPESSYELSLKDIVDDQQQLETVREKAVCEYHKRIHLETETQIKKQKKKKRKACPISTSGSMDADNFLIKMFFPSSQSLKIKKSTAENSSNVSPSPSFEKPVDKQWWIKRIFIGRDLKNREDSKNSRRSRQANRSSFPGCWLFFLSKKRN